MAGDKVSLYVQLAEDIKAYIASHALAPGERLPSFQELCGLFNVSHATVRAALNLLTTQGVVETRARQGAFVSAGRQVTSPLADARVIALLLSGEESAYEAAMIRGVMEQSLQAGYQVIVASNRSQVEVEAQQLDELSLRVCGLIVFPTHASGNYAAFAKLLERGVPWVFIDRGVPGLSAPLVATDNEHGGYLATRHLLEKGYREIFAISGKPVSSIQERIQGFRRAFKEFGLPCPPDRVRSSPHYLHTVGYTLTQSILQEKRGRGPLAIFALDETIATTCYAALKEAGVRIPQEVAVISYDDVNARYFDPPLSAVRQEPHRMGKEATRMLLEQIRTGKIGAPELRLKPQLVVRHSTDDSLPPAWADIQKQSAEEQLVQDPTP